MECFSSKRKYKPHITDTKPSQHDESSPQKPIPALSESNQTFGQPQTHVQNQQADSCIKFNNGWMFQGQHYEGKFHGWGVMTSDEGRVAYKGNFENGYFHKSGKIYNHSMFSYLFSQDQIKKWLDKKLKSFPQNQQKSSLRQIQVTNPFRMKANKFKKISQEQKQIKKRCNTQCMRISQESQLENSEIHWIKYEGDFEEGNATGFGTLKVKVSELKQEETFRGGNEKIFDIIGKFVNGKIVTGVLKEV